MHPAIVLLGGAVLLPLLPRRTRTAWFVAVPLAAGAALLALDDGVAGEIGFYGFDLTLVRVDGLSRAFAIVFVLVAFLGALYGSRTMATVERVAALAYAGTALGVVLAGDLLTLFLFWEAKAVAAVVLVWARRDALSEAAGTRYLLTHVAGGVTLLAGILWTYSTTGSLAFGEFTMGGPAALVLTGFLLSAAVPPLHAWLPDAYPVATAAGTVFLSAFTTKAAVYALARGFPGTEVLVWLGVVMAVYGVVYAMLENDIRRLLAYHIVSQVGFMVAAVGIGTEAAVNGATAHAFAHILYKGLLLMGAGAVLVATGRSQLTRLGGLARALPLVLVLYMVGAWSISAVPPFSGFVSKEIIVDAASLDGRYVVAWVLKFVAIGTFLSTALKLPYFTWFGQAEGADHARDVRPSPVPVGMYAAMAIAAALNIAIGIVPGPFYDLMPFAVEFEPWTAGKVVEKVQLLGFTALAFWLLRARLTGKATVSVDVDWTYRELPARIVAALRRRPRLGDRVPRPGRYGARDPVVRLRGAMARVVDDSTTREAPAPTWILGAVLIGSCTLLLATSVL